MVGRKRESWVCSALQWGSGLEPEPKVVERMTGNTGVESIDLEALSEYHNASSLHFLIPVYWNVLYI